MPCRPVWQRGALIKPWHSACRRSLGGLAAAALADTARRGPDGRERLGPAKASGRKGGAALFRCRGSPRGRPQDQAKIVCAPTDEPGLLGIVDARDQGATRMATSRPRRSARRHECGLLALRATELAAMTTRCLVETAWIMRAIWRGTASYRQRHQPHRGNTMPVP